MNILIMGANGLLGKKLVEKLSRDHNIYAVVKSKNEVAFNKNIKIIESDLANFTIDILPNDTDVIYYLAQSNRFREFPDGARDMFEVNINTPMKIVEWARRNGVKKFIYASSGGVYGKPNKPVKEFLNINANETNGFYLDGKLSAEILLKNYAQYFETFVIIRPFFMYGEGQNETMLIPRLINSIKNHKEIVLSGQEGIKINPIYIDDAVESVARILDITKEHVINIAGVDIISLKELALLIQNIVGQEPIFKYNNNIQNDLVADITAMQEKLAIPKIKLREGLERVVNTL